MHPHHGLDMSRVWPGRAYPLIHEVHVEGFTAAPRVQEQRHGLIQKAVTAQARG